MIAKGIFTRSVKYAVGEILLIFIGITISLLFDEWRQSVSKKEVEHRLLSHLSTSLMRDLNESQYAQHWTENGLHSCQQVLDLLEKKASPNSDSLGYFFATLTDYGTYAPDLAPIQNIKDVGYSILRNDSLKYMITRHYQDLEYLKPWTERILPENSKEYITPVLMNLMEFKFDETAELSRDEILQLEKNNSFQNGLRTQIGRLTSYKELLEIDRMQIVSLLISVNKELESKF